jgi:hypothetical protein
MHTHGYTQCLHTYIHSFIHAYIHTYIHTYTQDIHTCIHTYIQTYIHTYTQSWWKQRLQQAMKFQETHKNNIGATASVHKPHVRSAHGSKSESESESESTKKARTTHEDSAGVKPSNIGTRGPIMNSGHEHLTPSRNAQQNTQTHTHAEGGREKTDGQMRDQGPSQGALCVYGIIIFY